MDTAENQQQQAQAQQQPASEIPATPTAEEFAKMQAALKVANKEAVTWRKKMDELEKADEARKSAEMTELEKAKAEADKLKSEIISARREAIAARVGLPAEFASRLQGQTLEEIEADAQTFAAYFAKPNTPAQQTTSAAAPAAAPALTADAIAKITPQQINAQWEAVSAALTKQGK